MLRVRLTTTLVVDPFYVKSQESQEVRCSFESISVSSSSNDNLLSADTFPHQCGEGLHYLCQDFFRTWGAVSLNVDTDILKRCHKGSEAHSHKSCMNRALEWLILLYAL